MDPVKRSYRTEAPFVVSVMSGNILSTHWNSASAIEAAKCNGIRVIHGRQNGYWKPILVYVKGVKQ